MKTNLLKNIIKIDNITNNEKLALAVVLLILLIIITCIIYNFNDEEKIIYSEFNVEDLIIEAVNIHDRQEYFDLYGIITSFLSSYNLEIDVWDSNVDYDKIKYTREEYYEVLSKGYKKEVNKKKYMEISEEFCKKFLKENVHGDYVVVNENIINKIYKLHSKKYGENMYICELKTKIDEEFAYIGIHLDQIQKIYDIFYIN